MITELVLVNLAIFIAAVVQASAGVGFVMVGAPLVGLTSLAYVPGPILLANIFLSASMLIREGRAVTPREIAPLVYGLILGTIIGAMFLTLIPAEGLGVLLGSLVLGAVMLAVFAPQIRLTWRNVLFGATAGGFTGIVAGMHGPPLVMLYQHERPEKVRATFAVVFVFGCTLALVGLHLAGRFGSDEIWMGCSMIPGIVLGYGTGCFVAGRISRNTARAAMLIISGLGGAILLVKSL